MYNVYPYQIQSDQCSILTSDTWKTFSENTSIGIRLSCIFAHSFFEIGEKLHELPRRIYIKIIQHFPNDSPPILLEIAVKSIIDLIGDSWPVPSTLVFRIVLQIIMVSSELPTQTERMEVLSKSQTGMNNIIAKRNFSTALSKNIPSM